MRTQKHKNISFFQLSNVYSHYTVTDTVLDIGDTLESKVGKDLSLRMLSSESKLKPLEINIDYKSSDRGKTGCLEHTGQACHSD